MTQMPTAQPTVEYFAADEPRSFFLAFHVQSAFGFSSLAINFALALYAFSAGDCYNPHSSMWRSMLVVDILATVGFILDADSALKYEGVQFSSAGDISSPFSAAGGSPPFLLPTTAVPPSQLLSLPNQQLKAQSAADQQSKSAPPYATAAVMYDIAYNNFTVMACTAQRPYLFITLIARQWAALLVLFMGLERLLFVLYPLWLRSIRMNVGPINVFNVFFAMFSTGIAYTNATYVASNEPTHFSCEASWAFGQDYGWFFYGIVISPQFLGCLFCVIAYFMVYHEQALRKFGGNRLKLASEKRKIRKAKWLLITSSAFVAVPQSLLLALQLVAPQQWFLLKVCVSQLFLAKCFGNALVYNRAVASTQFGFTTLLKQCWDRRRKGRVNPTDAVNSVSFMLAQQHNAGNAQNQQQQQTAANA